MYKQRPGLHLNTFGRSGQRWGARKKKQIAKWHITLKICWEEDRSEKCKADQDKWQDLLLQISMANNSRKVMQIQKALVRQRLEFKQHLIQIYSEQTKKASMKCKWSKMMLKKRTMCFKEQFHWFEIIAEKVTFWR